MQPQGYEPEEYGRGALAPDQGASSMAAIAQLFARLSQEIEEEKPKNCIHFVVDFLCKHYPEHLHGFASIWQMDPDLERERHEVVNFFKAHKISTAVAAHFTNAGYDTLDTLTTLNKESLVDVEAFNNVKWLPGHKVRLQQIFGEIAARVRAYRQQYGNPNSRQSRTATSSARPVNLFTDLDRNGDGVISRSEFAALQAPTSYLPAAPPMFLPPQVAPVQQVAIPAIAAGPGMGYPGGCFGGAALSTPGPNAMNALACAAFPGGTGVGGFSGTAGPNFGGAAGPSFGGIGVGCPAAAGFPRVDAAGFPRQYPRA